LPVVRLSLLLLLLSDAAVVALFFVLWAVSNNTKFTSVAIQSPSDPERAVRIRTRLYTREYYNLSCYFTIWLLCIFISLEKNSHRKAGGFSNTCNGHNI
jgi:hypothetical protein